MIARRRKVKTFARGVKPNIGIQAAYRARLDKMIREMQASVVYWLESSYRNNEPVMAQDATPAVELKLAIGRLRRRWLRNFNEAAPELAKWFARSVDKRSTLQLKKILKDGGFSVEMQMSPAVRDVLKATIEANVSLIKSIPSQYFTQIESMVMNSVQTGRDLGTLSRDLQARYGVTARRAALIARDQNNKATAAINQARNLDLGLDKAIWRHSHAGKEPRPSHLANDGKAYDIKKGWFDPDERKWIQPGELINCRCYSVPVVPGF